MPRRPYSELRSPTIALICCLLVTLVDSWLISSTSATRTTRVAVPSAIPLASSKSDDNEIVESSLRTVKFLETAVPGPDLATKPDYENIHGPLGPWMDRIFQHVFRSQLAEAVGLNNTDTSIRPGFDGIIDLAAYMNKNFAPPEVHDRARTVLNRLFPSWMPSSYAVLFSKPFPAVSSTASFDFFL